MNIFVKISEDKHLIVVSNWLALIKLFRLFKGCLMFMNFVVLCVENKAVRDPAVITSEDKNL